VRLIDFGQSVHPKLGLSSKPGVSIPYSAPEFFSRYKFSPERCDIYSLGTMIFELVFNEVPQVLASNREKIVPWYQSAERYGLMFRFQP
jgi:serine/threonine protein kinase